MTAARYQQLKALFQEALERPPDQRAAYLVAVCAGDAELLQQAQALLAVDEEDGDHLIDAPLEAVASALLANGSAGLGHHVGPYRLERLVGQGGMGTVYEAWRADDQYRQRVAVKLIRDSAAAEPILERFRYERQILAGLTHPHIARLLDGGVMTDGRPYLVMEYAEGQPIDEYCEKHGLSIRDRIILFRDVCAAVQYAHQNLVVHRDLKPTNILVTIDGEVKLLDFGIAKLLREDENARGP